MLVHRRLCDANRWVACIDKARTPVTARSEPCAFAATDSSSPAGSTSESTDVRLWRTYASTTIFQSTAATTTTDASAAGTANAKLPSVSSAYTPAEQDAAGTTTAESVEPINSNAAAANATHAAHAEPCTATRHPAIARTVPASYPCSGWPWSHDRQAFSSTTKRSSSISIRATAMGNPSRKLRQPQCKRDSDQPELVRC